MVFATAVCDVSSLGIFIARVASVILVFSRA
jgi:hypothetical protein